MPSMRALCSRIVVVPSDTRVIRVDHADPDAEQLAVAASVLAGGGLVAFPTETVYGLGAVAHDRAAVASVFAAKGRPSSDPLIVHAHSVDALAPVVREWPDAAMVLAERFWPGPLTMVVPRTDAVVAEVSAGSSTVAVRVPAHPVALALLAATAAPVAAPSANRFGRISPTTAAHVLDELDGRIDVVVDGGPTTLGVESTVLDLTGPVPHLLRPGGVTLEDLVEVLGPVRHDERAVVPESEAAVAPGGFLRHYAPRTPLVLVDGPPRVRDELVEALRRQGRGAAEVPLPEDGPRAARELYGRLRDADAGPAEVLVASMVDPSGLGRAVNDRLFRAAHGRVVVDAAEPTLERLQSLLDAAGV
jgi:L-threonylcarbamoyladenylate synthase